MGRWLNRDPIGELDGPILYGFVWNNPVSRFDFLGLAGSNCGCKVTVLVEVPGKNVRGKLNRKGLGGYSGVGIDGEYYDYGPQPGRGGSIFGSPRRPWWNHFPEVNPSGNASLQDILDHLNDLSDENDTYTVTAEVNPEECARAKTYWDDLYNDPGTYRFYGRQCTTTVCRSLREAGLLTSRAVKPQTFLKRLRDNLKYTCGDKKGQPADVKQVHSGSPTSSSSSPPVGPPPPPGSGPATP